MPDPSPTITDLSWGEVAVEGHGRFRDAKLWPGGARAWDWNETDTHHDPGVQPADVRELLDHDPAVVVLSRGQRGRLGVMPRTRTVIEDRGSAVEVLETTHAVERYNTLAAEGEAVAALIHSTC